MKKVKKAKPKKRKTRDDEVYEKIKTIKEEPIQSSVIDDEIPSVFGDDLDTEDEMKEKEDDF